MLLRSSPLIPACFVGDRRERFTRDEAADVFQHDREAALIGVWPGVRAVRRDDDILHLPERTVTGEWLRLEDIERRARDPFFC